MQFGIFRFIWLEASIVRFTKILQLLLFWGIQTSCRDFVPRDPTGGLQFFRPPDLAPTILGPRSAHERLTKLGLKSAVTVERMAKRSCSRVEILARNVTRQELRDQMSNVKAQNILYGASSCWTNSRTTHHADIRLLHNWRRSAVIGSTVFHAVVSTIRYVSYQSTL